VLLLVGPEAGRSAMVKDVLAGSPALSAGVGTPREVLWLCPGGAANALGADEARLLGGDVAALPGILAMLNACVIGRSIPTVGYGGLSREGIEDIAGRMITSRFGVIAFSPADLGLLAMESLMALTRALNKGTRVTTLPLGPEANAGAGQQTAALVASWTTGFPPRTGFARGFPEYDPWRFDATRMVSAGECDAILWLSSFGAAAPSWRTDARLIAVTALGSTFAAPPAVHIETAVPGKDFSAEFYSEAMQALVHTEAEGAPETPSLPTPAAVLGGILTRLEARAS
jgi:formylmethanofuran dehydrogenase subunit B